MQKKTSDTSSTSKSFSFDKKVFINVPFDDEYKNLFYAIIFTIIDLGFSPHCTLEENNAVEARLKKIYKLIHTCKYGIHDLSRVEIDKKTKLPRFNMPFELGLDFGCRRYGNVWQRQKSILILEKNKYRYRKFISDLSGTEIRAHKNDVLTLIKCIRDWFSANNQNINHIFDGEERIFKKFDLFINEFPEICRSNGFHPYKVQFNDLKDIIGLWLDEIDKLPKKVNKIKSTSNSTFSATPTTPNPPT